MLYYPWRNEETDLKGDFPTYKEQYESVRETVHSNESMFSVNADEIDNAFEDLQRMNSPENVWNAVAPNVEFQQAEQQAEGVVQEREVPGVD